MSYYKVLGAYTFHSPYESWYSNNCNSAIYSYIKVNWNFINNYSFKIILKDRSNTLFVLTIKEILGDKFRVDSDDYGIEFELPYEGLISNYTIEECTSEELSNIRYKPLNKDQDNVFILEGADIKNHLFSVSKYGNPDMYIYTGEYIMFMSKWLRI